MSKLKGLEVDRRVGIALSVLPALQKELVQQVIHSPRSFAIAAALPGRVQQMANSGSPLYKMRISPSLRLIYTMVGDTVYVVDIVERETLRQFALKKVTQKSAKSQSSKKSPKASQPKLPGAINQ